MSTRSQTIINFGEKRVLTFYRHCDGYPQGHGCDLCKAVEKAGDDVIELLSLLRIYDIEIEPAMVGERGDVEFLYEVTYPDPLGYYPEGRPDVNVRITKTRSWESRIVLYDGTPKDVRIEIIMGKGAR